MTQFTRTFARTLLFFLTCCFCSMQAAAEGDGDYNGDGLVDGIDFFELAACMTGPNGEMPGPGCEAFDFDNGSGTDGFIDMADFHVLQTQTTGPDGCRAGKWYVRGQLSKMTTGCKGKITTEETTLCGESIASNKEAASLAWVGVVKRVGPVSTGWKWAEAGYTRWRKADEIVVRRNRYIEIKVTPGLGVDVLLRTFSMPAGNHEYSCDLATGQLFGIWTVEFDGGAVYTSMNFQGWQNETGTHADWTGEIHNKKDQMPGTDGEFSKCHFTMCKYRENHGGWESAIFTLDNVETDDSNEWRRDLGDLNFLDDFRIWDHRP